MGATFGTITIRPACSSILPKSRVVVVPFLERMTCNTRLLAIPPIRHQRRCVTYPGIGTLWCGSMIVSKVPTNVRLRTCANGEPELESRFDAQLTAGQCKHNSFEALSRMATGCWTEKSVRQNLQTVLLTKNGHIVDKANAAGCRPAGTRSKVSRRSRFTTIAYINEFAFMSSLVQWRPLAHSPPQGIRPTDRF